MNTLQAKVYRNIPCIYAGAQKWVRKCASIDPQFILGAWDQMCQLQGHSIQKQGGKVDLISLHSLESFVPVLSGSNFQGRFVQAPTVYKAPHWIFKAFDNNRIARLCIWLSQQSACDKASGQEFCISSTHMKIQMWQHGPVTPVLGEMEAGQSP